MNEYSRFFLSIFIAILTIFFALPTWAFDFVAYYSGEGPKMSQKGNAWKIEIPGDTTGDPISGGYSTACRFRGDFDIQVDFSLDQWPGESGVRVALGTSGYSLSRFSLGEHEFAHDESRERYAMDFGGGEISYANATDTTGRLRMTRVGGKLTGYYQGGGGWVPLRSGVVSTYDTNIALVLHTRPNLFAQKTVSATFDNFIINNGECVMGNKVANKNKEPDPFGDEVVSWTPGHPTRKDGPCDPSYALGAPNYGEDTIRSDPKSCSLGCGGELVVRFVDNDLVNGNGADLSVYEVGTDESYSVDISTDGANWINLGKSKGGKADFDIGEKAKKGERFYYVRINDLKSNCKNCCPGVDIDSVKALHTSADIQAAASTELPIEEETEYDLSFTMDPFSKPLATGKKSETFITVTNTGDTPIVKPVVSVKFSGNAIPRRSVRKKKSLSMNAGVEFAGGEAPNVEIQWERYGFKTQIVNDKDFSLKPGDSRRIRISIIPRRGGELSITANVTGQSRPKGKEVNVLITEKTVIEQPILELDVPNIEPMPYAHDQESKLPLHKGKRITLEFLLDNSSKNADLKNGTFWIKAFYGEVRSLTSEDQKADCPKLNTPQKTASCKIPHLGAGEFGYFSTTIIYDAPEKIHAGASGSGVAANHFIYEIGANVDPVVHVKFSPDPELKFVTPGTEITAEFTIRNSGEDILDKGELLIYPPDRNVYPELYIKELTGCPGEIIGVDSEIWSDVYGSSPRICLLDSFSLKNPARIKATFGKIQEITLSQDALDMGLTKETVNDIVIAWDLKMPAYTFRPGDETRGSVAYKITPEFVDLSVEGYENLGESLPGEIEDADLFISNKGSVAQKEVTLNIEINLTRSEEYDESTNKKLQFPGGKNYLDWFKQPILSTADSKGKSIDFKCPKKPGMFNKFECALGTLHPGDFAMAFIEWDQELPAGVIYSYNAGFKKNGQGEGTLGGSLDDNHIKGSGKVVKEKNPILEDTECVVQEPNGQITIKYPNDGIVKDRVIEVKQLTNAHGSFDSIPIGMEIWAYSFSRVTSKYTFEPARMYDETSGDWTVKGLGFGRPGKDIGFIYKLGVVLVDQCTGNTLEENPSGFISLPKGVKKMDEIEVTRI